MPAAFCNEGGMVMLGFIARSCASTFGWFIRAGALLVAAAPVAHGAPCGTGDYPFPYTDVAAVGDAFCPGILQAYVVGVTKGTTPTTFSPNQTVDRTQMTTFLQRSFDQELRRGSRRAALNQWWTPSTGDFTQRVAVGAGPRVCAADGKTLWTPSRQAVHRIEASTGKVLGTWTGIDEAFGVIVAAGSVFVTTIGFEPGPPSQLYVIDPTQPPGVMTPAVADLGYQVGTLAFDGSRLWTRSSVNGKSSIITVEATPPYAVTKISTDFIFPMGLLFDGANVWVVDWGAGKLLKLDAAGAIIQEVSVGLDPTFPVFDGANIWVPNEASNTVTVVQASTGTVIATLAGDALTPMNRPFGAAFDGERVLITSQGNSTLHVFRAADLALIRGV